MCHRIGWIGFGAFGKHQHTMPFPQGVCGQRQHRELPGDRADAANDVSRRRACAGLTRYPVNLINLAL
jgi:hypothetical protein